MVIRSTETTISGWTLFKWAEIETIVSVNPATVTATSLRFPVLVVCFHLAREGNIMTSPHLAHRILSDGVGRGTSTIKFKSTPCCLVGSVTFSVTAIRCGFQTEFALLSLTVFASTAVGSVTSISIDTSWGYHPFFFDLSTPSLAILILLLIHP